MASQGISCRRGCDQARFSRVHQVGVRAGAESYVSSGTRGPNPPIQASLFTPSLPAGEALLTDCPEAMSELDYTDLRGIT